MSEFSEVFNESLPERKEYAPVPPMNGKVLFEVKSVEVRDTQDGMGRIVRLELRCGTKPWGGRKVFSRFFIASKKTAETHGEEGERAQKAAQIGRKQLRELVDACGFHTAEDANKDERRRRAVAMGIASVIEPGSFDAKMLVGRHFIGNVATPKLSEEQERAGEKAYPELKWAEAIDPEQFSDLVRSGEFARNDEKDEGVAPF